MNNYTFREISLEDHQAFFDSFVGEKSFLQSSAYARFRTTLGEPTTAYGVFDNERQVASTIIQHIPAKKGQFLHIPHGILTTDNNIWDFFLDQYKSLGKTKKVDFVRISPLLSPDAKPIFDKAGFRDAATHLQNPEKTWILDLSPSEEELIANMTKSTRYEMRRIEKFGVEVKVGNSAQDLDIFWELHSETVRRQKFVPFPRSSTEKEMDIFGDNCQIFSAKYEDQYLSSSVILFDDHAGYYHQGASERCKAPVAYASLWEAIKYAKQKGCQEFNFWGVVGEDEKGHPWYGLSHFKRGFGGEERNYLHAQDFAITTKYHLARTIERYRKWKRHY